MIKLPNQYTDAEWDSLSDNNKALAWAHLETELASLKPKLARSASDLHFHAKVQALNDAIEAARTAADDAIDTYRSRQGLSPIDRKSKD